MTATLEGPDIMWFKLPLRLVSEKNQREHWAKKAKRVKAHRNAVALLLGSRLRVVTLPCAVTITRIAPRALDDDNATRSASAVRDEVARLLGVDDRDERVTWRPVEQRRGKVREYACAIRIEWSDGASRSERGARPPSEVGSGISRADAKEANATLVRE